MKLSDLNKILNLPNATFVNLQYGDVDNEIQEINKQVQNKILNLKDINMFNDIESMASLISQLDLVLTQVIQLPIWLEHLVKRQF